LISINLTTQKALFNVIRIETWNFFLIFQKKKEVDSSAFCQCITFSLTFHPFFIVSKTKEWRKK
jgi:hypothetical protein